MKVELTEDDVALLSALIKARIEEIGPEIRHTRTPEFHDELKVDKARLQALQKRLSSMATSA